MSVSNWLLYDRWKENLDTIVETSTVQDDPHTLFISFILNFFTEDCVHYITVQHGSPRPPLPHFFHRPVNLFVIGGSTYHLRNRLIYNLEEHEARMDELEGTLRGHIGLIEEALDRLEGNSRVKGKKMEDLYSARGRDDSKK